MNRYLLPAVVVATSMAFAASTCNAAILLSLRGTLTSGSGSVLGNIPPARDFTLSVDFTPVAPGLATVNSGVFDTSLAAIMISGGDIILNDNGSNDQATFVLDTSSPTGALTFNFFGDAITDNQVSLINLSKLINGSPPADIAVNFGTGGDYVGKITAIPEPGFGALMLAATAMLGCGRRGHRRR